jgi:hypothetical protein
MAQKRYLKFSFRKNAIHDRRGSRALSDLWSRTLPGERCPCTSGELTFLGLPSRTSGVSFEDVVYLYRDLYMP